MKINVGTTNQVKVDAVREILKSYKMFSGAEVIGIHASSEVPGQPISLDQTVSGAINRAINSFDNCDYSFGIESGLTEVPYTKTGYLDFCACSIYDGKQHHLGLSCGIEFPPGVIKRIFEENVEIDEACFREGITDNRKIGRAEGLIGILTKGRISRKEYTQQAIQMALVHLENPELYR